MGKCTVTPSLPLQTKSPKVVKPSGRQRRCVHGQATVQIGTQNVPTQKRSPKRRPPRTATQQPPAGVRPDRRVVANLLPSGLYRRLRLLTGSALRLVDSTSDRGPCLTTGRELECRRFNSHILTLPRRLHIQLPDSVAHLVQFVKFAYRGGCPSFFAFGRQRMNRAAWVRGVHHFFCAAILSNAPRRHKEQPG